MEYYRLTCRGTMPQLTSTNIDAWTIATERPSGSHIEHGSDVYYDCWLTLAEVKTQHPDLVHGAEYTRNTFKPEAVGEALPF